MNEWKVVPVEPTKEMVSEMEFQSGQFSDRRKVLRAVISVSPTPPVVLPPLPGGKFAAFGRAEIRAYARSYARAALAQYGIKEKGDE